MIHALKILTLASAILCILLGWFEPSAKEAGEMVATSIVFTGLFLVLQIVFPE